MFIFQISVRISRISEIRGFDFVVWIFFSASHLQSGILFAIFPSFHFSFFPFFFTSLFTLMYRKVILLKRVNNRPRKLRGLLSSRILFFFSSFLHYHFIFSMFKSPSVYQATGAILTSRWKNSAADFDSLLPTYWRHLCNICKKTYEFRNCANCERTTWKKRSAHTNLQWLATHSLLQYSSSHSLLATAGLGQPWRMQEFDGGTWPHRTPWDPLTGGGLDKESPRGGLICSISCFTWACCTCCGTWYTHKSQVI